jgi:hypothetical protein
MPSSVCARAACAAWLLPHRLPDAGRAVHVLAAVLQAAYLHSRQAPTAPLHLHVCLSVQVETDPETVIVTIDDDTYYHQV